MSNDFELNAEVRELQGKGASRRLRHTGQVPAILYGGHKEPVMLALSSIEVEHKLKNESFYSHILTLKLKGGEESAVLKDLQRHPARSTVMHMDLQRVLADEEIRMNVPIHFKGEDIAPGVKLEGGVVQHLMMDVEVSCLPRYLPEFIEVDVSAMKLDEAIHLADLKREGVEFIALQHGENPAVVTIHIPRVIEEPVAEEAAPVAEVPTVGDEAKAAAEAEGAEAEKGGGKKDDKAGKKDEKGGK